MVPCYLMLVPTITTKMALNVMYVNSNKLDHNKSLSHEAVCHEYHLCLIVNQTTISDLTQATQWIRYKECWSHEDLDLPQYRKILTFHYCTASHGSSTDKACLRAYSKFDGQAIEVYEVYARDQSFKPFYLHSTLV